ncbi:sugar phosphate isomerase/epimerase family protein [Nibricoccus sp. IMCC34717]|uniref:sugar phosphate isomerase/epimerase family protein n=1 Tax=Nibricoccus sp. IMCC34717 TaxID=3034021 RepID=UPI0038501135
MRPLRCCGGRLHPMKLIYTKSNWEVSQLPISEFLALVRRDGFDAAEIYLPNCQETPAQLGDLVAQAGLQLVAQAATEGTSVAEHIDSLEKGYLAGVAAKAISVNFHTGRDIFTHEQNLAIFLHGQKLMQQHGVPLLHETHRGRALFTGPGTFRYLQEIPDLLLTVDFSHWFCVHESDLRDQEENLDAAIRAARHIHARVGFGEGPQVGDPRGPAFQGWLERHEELWKRVIALRKAAGDAALTLTPEFGPPPYMPIHPLTDTPVADTWAVNCWMREHLASAFGRTV